jgi:hypothetical protein
MHKFHSIAALCGDGLRPELQALFDRLAIDPHSELFVRSDSMTQSGPDPMQDFSERSPKTAPAQGLGRLESEIGIGGNLAAPPSHTTGHTGPYPAVQRIEHRRSFTAVPES